MKRIVLAALLFFISSASAQIHIDSDDIVTLSGRTLDSSGFYIAPDSVRLVVYRNGSEEHDAWYNASDAECSTINDMLVFADAFGDIDNDAGDGLYEIMAGFFEDNGDLYLWKTLWVYLGVDLDSMQTNLQAALDSLQAHDDWVARQSEVGNLDGWNPLTDHDSLVVDMSSLAARPAIGDTIQRNASVFDPSSDEVSADVVKLSGSALAANNLEETLDEDMVFGVKMELGQLYVSAEGNDPGVVIGGHGSGDGIYIASGADGGYGAQICSRRLSGMRIIGAEYDSSNGSGLIVLGGVGDGSSGDGVRIYGGSESGQAVRMSAPSGHGLTIDADSTAVYLSGDNGIEVRGDVNDILADLNGWVDSVCKPVRATAYVDSADLARAIWNAPQANHTASGTFGKYLDTEISGMGSGSGAYAVTVVVWDSSSLQVVGQVSLAVRNIDQSSLVAVGRTNSLGRADVNLDADSFIVTASAPGYIFTAYDTLVVTGAVVDTVYGFRFDPGCPASPSLCRVYGFLYTVEGEPEENAVVSACLPHGVDRAGDMIVSPFSVSAESDSTGYFCLDLISSSSLVGSESTYEITINRSDGTILRKRLTVPDSPNWQLAW